MRKFEIVKDSFRKYPDQEIILPKRATVGSAGYDFVIPVDVAIIPKTVAKIPTDIKVCMEDYEVLMMFIRSSVGIKKQVMLANGTGIIDSDFYNNSDNDGGITLALYNYGDNIVCFGAGERIAQGVFVPFGVTNDENEKNLLATRTGGIGSTDGK